VDWFRELDRMHEPRYPAALAELLFNGTFAVIFLFMRRRKIRSSQHFHLYLIAYGMFRFVTEFWRATPRFPQGFSGYQIIALALILLGAIRFVQRGRTAANQKKGSLVEARCAAALSLFVCATGHFALSSAAVVCRGKF
jgi:phosphatidylglycerol:prolipoprotein diacylglycerol transferase